MRQANFMKANDFIPWKRGVFIVTNIYLTMRKIILITILSFTGFMCFAQQPADQSSGKGRTVLLDSYFNNEHKKDSSGKLMSYHYKWEDKTNDGFSIFGSVFNRYGLKTATLYNAPNAENLKSAAIYIIVDPDIPQENPNPKYIEPEHITAICNWVKSGGVLVV